MHLAELANNPQWLNGPIWLCDSEGKKLQVNEERCLHEMKAQRSCQLMQSSHNLLSSKNGADNSIMECKNFSTLRRLLRATAHFFKVAEILKAKTGKGDAELAIIATDMAKPELYWVKIAQYRLEASVRFSTWKLQFKMLMDEAG